LQFTLISRHGANSIPELVDNYGIGIAYLKKIELINSTKNVNRQIQLPFNFLIQKYFFHDNPT